jgi:hypothetical protein
MEEYEHTDCPLCSRTVENSTELRIHLMVEHRKSTVIEEYVDRLERAVLAP